MWIEGFTPFPSKTASSGSAPSPAPTSRLPNLPRPRSNGAEGPGRAGDGMSRDSADGGGDATENVTLGQMRAQAAGLARARSQRFDFRYDDTDTLMNELNEFYPYIEMAYVQQNATRFEGSFSGKWTTAPLRKRREYVEKQLEYLESPVTETRRAAQGRLLYLLQGCFAETESSEDQLHWIIANAQLIRSVDGVATLVLGLRDAARRYDASDVLDKAQPSAPAHERSGSSNLQPAPFDPFDTHSAELMDVLAMLYFLVEVSRSDDTFGDELMAVDPPLPIVLINMVAGLKDRSVPKGYPVKKVLLLLWKTLLACLGGMREAAKTKALSRELAGLGPEKKDFTKATPMDIALWRRDTSTKYPTFAPAPSVPDGVPVSTEVLAESIKPMPPKPNYHSTEYQSGDLGGSSSSQFSTIPTQSLPQPGTPAPTPPQSPQQRPKKLQFQTDPSRPFVFPYSQPAGGPPASLVPYAIDEADKLYHDHVFVSLALYQLWESREDYLREERGLGQKGLIGFSSLHIDDEQDEAAEEAMRRDWRYEEEEMRAQNKGDTEGVRLAQEKRAAARRLYRVEVIYRSMLPIMQNAVIVLLKLLLATVTSTSGPQPMQQQHNQGVAPALASPTQEAPPADDRPPPTREEIDIARHREITSKAVSAIIIILLKWFKASHILKYHHLTQLLLDSNCLVLVLKIFGLQEISQMVQTKNEMKGCSFFEYCRGLSTPEDELNRPESPTDPPTPPVEEEEDGTEVEIITDYSWRNFFSAINLVKILQKITKHRIHRILLMCQYKSSTILKRVLRVNQPMLQLQVLKLIKSQMPYCGRKWRSTNMKVITSIYLNCRPELRNDWLVGVEADLEAEDAVAGKPQEFALRTLVAFYNKQHYAAHFAAAQVAPDHRRGDSQSALVFDEPGLVPAARRRSRLDSVSSDAGLFPMSRSASDLALMPYNPDGMIEFWMHEYEDVLREVFGEGTTQADEDWDEYGDGAAMPPPSGAPGPAERDDAAWVRLGELMRARGGQDDDTISDSESVVTVGELGDEAQLEAAAEGREMFNAMHERQRRKSKGDENTWEHMSPDTLKLLPRSPTDRRRSSSGGSPLRPVMGLGPLLGDDFGDVFEDDAELPGPMPIDTGTRDELEREYGAVDEVEYAYGE
ncbi:Factor arrest protein 11 [Vanrija albida]|uniref:Factor arrest protein 11 n=1 Tax=Vanrija albida TaxID=181172 RepID=A0ABR3PSI7_9TREE